MKFSDRIRDLNDAMFPTIDKNNPNVIGAFGGESVGFARGVAEQYSSGFYQNTAPADAFTVPTAMAGKDLPKSIGNSYALFNFQGFSGGLENTASANYIDSDGNPLMGGKDAHSVSIPKIINFFDTHYKKINYKPADFLYSKYYKKIPVNHLVTLRRFPTPIPDNIYDLKEAQAAKKEGEKPKKIGETIYTAGVTAVTYLGETAGNTLEDILTMSFGTNWKEIESEMEAIASNDGGYTSQPLSYVNPKVAMIDIMSNMLTMTTNNAQFFGGGHRYYGSAGAVANQFGDINKLKGGDFSGYMGSVVQDVETGFSNLFGTGDGGFDANSIVDGLKKVGTTMLGNVLGGFLSGNVGAVSGTQATKTFISGEPTGNWHVTVGNPLNPIVMMGNMICDNATMTLGAGLGYDDFPMEVSFELDIKHGKPRDKGDIENMFNAGRGRIYASAQNVDDILNLKGLEVQTYGSKPDVGTSSIQKSSNEGLATGSANNESIGNVGGSGDGSNMSANAAYVSNLTSMMIDS